MKQRCKITSKSFLNVFLTSGKIETMNLKNNCGDNLQPTYHHVYYSDPLGMILYTIVISLTASHSVFACVSVCYLYLPFVKYLMNQWTDLIKTHRK